jgi:glycosyltransferase involved in cell wall biosynthesis
MPRISEKQIDLLWVSRCQQLKRPHLYLDLVEALPDARCTMICPSEDKELWDSVAERAAKLPNLELIEKVPYHEIQEYYDRARVFVNTSTFEGFPNSFIQSGMGHAALLSLCIDPDGMIQVFGSGILADGSMEKMIEGARTMLSDKGMLFSMQEGSACMVKEWLDNEANVQRYLDGLEHPALSV